LLHESGIALPLDHKFGVRLAARRSCCATASFIGLLP
jgi:hypothetical protein